MQSRRLALAFAGLVASSALAAGPPEDPKAPPAASPTGWKQHDVRRPKPPVAEPAGEVVPAAPPKDAVVLFDGSNLDAWKSPSGGAAKWKVVDGATETLPGAGPIVTRKSFGDIQLHIEWAAPQPPDGKGQDRGNSGVFLMGQFEVQVLDSYRAETYADGQAGAIYGQYPPLFNASRPPGQWQSYDIAFRRPRFDPSGTLTEPARISVLHNGLLVQNNEEPFGPTSWLKWLPYADNGGGRGPIQLQDHDHPVRYRNIWLREMPERPAPTGEALAAPKVVPIAGAALDACVGTYLMGDRPGAPRVAIARSGDHLTVTFPFRPQALALLPVSETEFAMPHTDGRFVFRRDAAGRVEGANFRIGDGERDLKRVRP